MDQEMLDRVRVCRSEVLANAQHELSFGTRRRMLLAFGPELPAEQATPGVFGPGKRRRSDLAMACARKVLPLWSQYFNVTYPADLLQLAERCVAGTVTEDALKDEAYSLAGGLENNDVVEKQIPYLIGNACVCAAYATAVDELLTPDEGASQEELDDPQDPDHWDAAFWAAGAYAGGMPWVDSFDKAKYLEFWNWYLDDAVPAAWNTVAE